MKTRKIILTCEIQDDDFTELQFQKWVASEMEDTVTNWVTLTDTSKMYKEDSFFKSISKSYYKARQVRNDYINEHNARYIK
jgi:hypothetical protein